MADQIQKRILLQYIENQDLSEKDDDGFKIGEAL